MATNELISEIKEKFNSDIKPNGILLTWDRNRFYESLQLLLNEYKIVNQTDFNYSFCNSFDIKIGNRNSCGEIYKITLKISFILDIFVVYIINLTNKKVGKVISEDEIPEAKIICNKLRNYLAKQNFKELLEDVDIEVPGVKLELAQKATIGKCLFDDF